MRDIKDEAADILNIFRFYRMDGSLYLKEDDERLDALFDAVVDALNDCGVLKPKLPHNEFVVPCRKLADGDPGWIGHFEDRDNRRFFLSDVYDFLKLFYGPSS